MAGACVETGPAVHGADRGARGAGRAGCVLRRDLERDGVSLVGLGQRQAPPAPPVTGWQFRPVALQRTHWLASEVGLFAHAPWLAVRVIRRTGLPETDGATVSCGSGCADAQRQAVSGDVLSG